MPTDPKPCPVEGLYHTRGTTLDVCRTCPNRRAQSPAVRELVEAIKGVALDYGWPSTRRVYDAIAAVEREGGA